MEDLLKQIRKLNKKIERFDLINIELEFEDDMCEMILRLRVEEGIHMGATYQFQIKFNDDFLESCPTITCLSDIYHPNIKEY